MWVRKKWFDLRENFKMKIEKMWADWSTNLFENEIGVCRALENNGILRQQKWSDWVKNTIQKVTGTLKRPWFLEEIYLGAPHRHAPFTQKVWGSLFDRCNHFGSHSLLLLALFRASANCSFNVQECFEFDQQNLRICRAQRKSHNLCFAIGLIHNLKRKAHNGIRTRFDSHSTRSARAKY